MLTFETRTEIAVSFGQLCNSVEYGSGAGCLSLIVYWIPLQQRLGNIFLKKMHKMFPIQCSSVVPAVFGIRVELNHNITRSVFKECLEQLQIQLPSSLPVLLTDAYKQTTSLVPSPDQTLNNTYSRQYSLQSYLFF